MVRGSGVGLRVAGSELLVGGFGVVEAGVVGVLVSGCRCCFWNSGLWGLVL